MASAVAAAAALVSVLLPLLCGWSALPDPPSASFVPRRSRAHDCSEQLAVAPLLPGQFPAPLAQGAAALVASACLSGGVASAPAFAAAGEEVFTNKCVACHAAGGNVVNPAKTLQKASLQRWRLGGGWLGRAGGAALDGHSRPQSFASRLSISWGGGVGEGSNTGAQCPFLALPPGRRGKGQATAGAGAGAGDGARAGASIGPMHENFVPWGGGVCVCFLKFVRKGRFRNVWVGGVG